MSATDTDLETRLADLFADVDAAGLQPLWTQTKQLVPARPNPTAIPWLWKGETLRALAIRARDLITIERGGERRVLALANPGLAGAPFATSTLWGAIQVLGPHESAPAHRHTASALRFVLEGRGVWTTVDGDACTMEPGDLILTPAWTFHDHTNDGSETMLWFDGLDLPLIGALDASFYENFPELRQPVLGFDLSEAKFKAPGLIAEGPSRERRLPSLLRYRWAHTDSMLTRLISDAEGPMASLEFVDPATGGPPLPTMSCAAHRIRPGDRSVTRRTTGSSIFVVFRGHGRSVIAGRSFEWEHGDMFVVPSWQPVDHEADVTSDLFEVSDAATLRALGLFRTETTEPQAVEGPFLGLTPNRNES